MCAELSLANVPTVYVPLPLGKEQKENAKKLSDAGKAVVVEHGDSFSKNLAAAIREISNTEIHLGMRETEYHPPFR